MYKKKIFLIKCLCCFKKLIIHFGSVLFEKKEKKVRAFCQ